MMAGRNHIFLTLSIALFLSPAVVVLVRQTWQSEAGSLSPLILCLGAWTLWHRYRDVRTAATKGSMGLWASGMAIVFPIYAFASAIGMATLLAFAAWAGFALTFYALVGAAVTRNCAFPLLFLGLVVPLPYALSVDLNTVLRTWISVQSVDVAALLGMDVASGHGEIAIGPYILAVENACAGVNSTISLVAVGLLFAHWVSEAGIARVLVVALLAIPIALAANVLRVVALIGLVGKFGSGILSSMVHPLSGVISFLIALTLLTGAMAFVTLVSSGKGSLPSFRAAT